MRLLVSSCARLFKTPDGKVYTPVVYGYEFYKRYLKVFDEVRVVGFCDIIDEKKAESMLLVSGYNLSVYEVPYPHGEWDYIFKRMKIILSLKKATDGCDAVLLRVPETLCFLIMDKIINKNIPWAIEVTSDPINLYTKLSCPSKYRFVYKYYYYYQLRRASKYATGTSYVTQYGLQKRYPPNLKKKDHFTNFYTDANVQIDSTIQPRVLPRNKRIGLIHISVSIAGFAKGHKEAIEALAFMVKSGLKVELTLVGGGELAQENIDFIERQNLQKYIHLTGKLTADQVISELDKADVFFFPSYNEGLPRVVVEAMSRALPVIATDIPAHRELLKEEYLAPVRDSHGIFVIAKRLLTDSSAYSEASRRSLDKAKEYDIQLIEKKRTDFYKQLRSLAENRKSYYREDK